MMDMLAFKMLLGPTPLLSVRTAWRSRKKLQHSRQVKKLDDSIGYRPVGPASL